MEKHLVCIDFDCVGMEQYEYYCLKAYSYLNSIGKAVYEGRSVHDCALFTLESHYSKLDIEEELKNRYADSKVI